MGFWIIWAYHEKISKYRFEKNFRLHWKKYWCNRKCIWKFKLKKQLNIPLSVELFLFLSFIATRSVIRGMGYFPNKYIVDMVLQSCRLMKMAIHFHCLPVTKIPLCRGLVCCIIYLWSVHAECLHGGDLASCVKYQRKRGGVQWRTLNCCLPFSLLLLSFLLSTSVWRRSNKNAAV